jgi:hypothetical protein
MRTKLWALRALVAISMIVCAVLGFVGPTQALHWLLPHLNLKGLERLRALEGPAAIVATLSLPIGVLVVFWQLLKDSRHRLSLRQAKRQDTRD